MKKSSITRYGLTEYQLLNLKIDQELNVTWTEFQNEAFYQLGRDFQLFYNHDLRDGSHIEIPLSEGNNEVTTNGQTIQLEKLLTYGSGLCYKMTPIRNQGDFGEFKLQFNENLRYRTHCVQTE